jgi:hypothetical protein
MTVNRFAANGVPSNIDSDEKENREICEAEKEQKLKRATD